MIILLLISLGPEINQLNTRHTNTHSSTCPRKSIFFEKGSKKKIIQHKVTFCLSIFLLVVVLCASQVLDAFGVIVFPFFF
jgi:hypothetical protein